MSKIKCRNCRLITDCNFPSDKCSRCWEVINLKKHPDYVLAKKVLTNYGVSAKEAKKILEDILTDGKCNLTIDSVVLVKLAFAQYLRTDNENYIPSTGLL